MHPFLAKLTGRTALQNWRRHIADADNSCEKLQQISLHASYYENEIDKARETFEKDPSIENLNHWANAEARRGAMTKLSEEIRIRIAIQKETALRDGGAAKLIAAVEEAESVLDAREKEIWKNMNSMKESLGVSDESQGGINKEVTDKIDRMRKELNEARGFAHTNFMEAVSRLNTLVGTE